MFPFMFAEDGPGGGDDDSADDPDPDEGGDDDDVADDGDDVDDELPEDFDKEGAKDFIKKLRKNEQDLQKALKKANARLSQFEADRKKAEDADKSDLEKALGRVEELEGSLAQVNIQLRETLLSHAIEEEASKPAFSIEGDKDKKYPFRAPDLVTKLIQADGDLFKLLEYDEETGEAKAIPAALKKLAKDYPHLLDVDSGPRGLRNHTPSRDEERRTEIKSEALSDMPVEESLGISRSF
jgi:Rad3-related DNA helicase